MSKSKSIGCYAGPVPSRPDPWREIWAHDASVSLVLNQVISTVEEAAPGQRPAWWAAAEEDLRLHAAVNDLYLDLGQDLDTAGREEFARLLDGAADSLLAQGDAEEAAELARALAALLRGGLEAPPPGALWLYGAPGGPTAVAMAALSPELQDQSTG